MLPYVRVIFLRSDQLTAEHDDVFEKCMAKASEKLVVPVNLKYLG